MHDDEEKHRTAREIVDAVAHHQPNACDLIHEIARKDPELLALVEVKTGDKMTFAELSTTIAKVASRLAMLGLKPRDRVALFVADGPRFVILVNALFQLGAVPVLIDPGMGVDAVANCIREQKPRGLVGIKKAQLLRLMKRDAFSSVKVNVVVDGWFPGAKTVSTAPDGGVPESKQRREPYQPVHRQTSSEPAAVLYTSGSTGAPKGVLYTHGMLMAQSQSIRDMFGIARGDVDVCCFLPFALFSVAMGTTAVFPDMDFRVPAKANPQKILQALQSGAGKSATSAFASPALWEPFSHFLISQNVKLSGLKRVLTAGAPVRPQLHARLLQALPDGDVFTPYGATEALPVAFMSGRAVVGETAAQTRTGRGTCVGKLAPGVAVTIIGISDDAIATLADAVVLPAGETGEIVVKGPCVTTAYDVGTRDVGGSDRGAQANALSKIKDGDDVWHRMGDVGFVDEQGRLWFCGRKSHRVVKADDKVLHSVCVEAVVEAGVESRVAGAGGENGADHRAALVGVGERGSQKAVVFVEDHGKPLHMPSLDELRSWPGCAAVDELKQFAGSFPVDRRHNAKIEREKLAATLKG